ncbi:hypothetical protein SCLCIDRAFT_944921 [Scleroderma citrinum Foug A]|uniref:Uncharacterized protein n=1 Tax=Scleroderma citrinum Foug A TaxID=1036808 RepID=A0A0C3DWG7_9AGAM|nr:hypothetical protein SCLCIDRAFT_944921 [Scleroderma citrinum Foug A]
MINFKENKALLLWKYLYQPDELLTTLLGGILILPCSNINFPSQTLGRGSSIWHG